MFYIILMQVSYINLSTLILFFLPILITKKSVNAFIILFNGIIFHTHRDNKLLLCYDLFTNILLIFYVNYYNQHIRKLSSVVCFLTSINFYTLRKYRFQEYKHDVFHSIITHGLGSYCLYQIY